MTWSEACHIDYLSSILLFQYSCFTSPSLVVASLIWILVFVKSYLITQVSVRPRVWGVAPVTLWQQTGSVWSQKVSPNGPVCDSRGIRSLAMKGQVAISFFCLTSKACCLKLWHFSTAYCCCRLLHCLLYQMWFCAKSCNSTHLFCSRKQQSGTNMWAIDITCSFRSTNTSVLHQATRHNNVLTNSDRKSSSVSYTKVQVFR